MTTPRVGPVVWRLTRMGETAGHHRREPSVSECRGRVCYQVNLPNDGATAEQVH